MDSNRTSLSTPVYSSTTQPHSSVLQFIANHVWIPVVAVIALLPIIAVIIYCVCKYRQRSRYDYTALKEDMALPDKLVYTKKRERDEVRDVALIHCSFYLRNCGFYSMIDHLPDIGSRLTKQWFLVRELRNNQDRLLTLVKKGPDMLLPCTPDTQRTLAELFIALKHPYVYPVCHIDFIYNHELVVLVQPYHKRGTLKDVIYQAHCTDEWHQKYYLKGQGLPVPQIQLLAQQIMQALMFLQKKGFPPFSHLHSGNVIMEESTCRLTGAENCILGLQSKMLPMLKKKLKHSSEAAMESLCLGHLLFEMAVGYELDTAHPQPRHLVNVSDTGLIEVLNMIFNADGLYPTIEEILQHPFFRGLILKELQTYNPAPIHFTKEIKLLLKCARQTKTSKKVGGLKKTTPKLSISRGKSKRLSKADKTKKGLSSTSDTLGPSVEMGSLQMERKLSQPNGSNQENEADNVDDLSLVSVIVEAPGEPVESSALLDQIRQGRALRHVVTPSQTLQA